ncbi:MAG TPA: glycosyltransferase family 39 protein [Gaiellaceae bacterium]|nr:glycosyltransferase family 39 protein [Gaiellaceae bacterium]
MTETVERRRITRTPKRERAHVVARLRELPVAWILGALAIGAGIAILLLRVVEDVRGKPLFEDEAVAGLISARPLGEMLETVWWERGGPPLHFLLSHVAIAFDSSPFTLRWLAVVFAVATIPVCWDLGRRLAGPAAGATAALVAAASPMLAVYGSFGRMYSLYAFASALAADLFVRALRERTPRAALAAALAAWFLPAIHPYGAIAVAAEALVALWIWRGKPLRPALPVLGAGLALVPFLFADVRLAQRFSVGLGGETSIATPGDALGQVWRAVQASAGGQGWALAAAVVLASVGLAVLAWQGERAFVAYAAFALLVPPALLLVLRTSTEPGLSPRHLMFVLPLVAALIGVAVARAVRGRRASIGLVAVVAVGAIFVSAPAGGIREPRNWANDVLGGGPAATALGGEDALAAPKAWLEDTVRPGTVLFPYSAVYLSALPATRDAVALPYAQTPTLLRSLERVDTPVRRLVVSAPIGATTLSSGRLASLLGPGLEAERFGPWLLVEGKGPYADGHAVLLATYRALVAVRDSTTSPRKDELSWYFTTTLSVLCGSLRTFGESCPPRSLDWLLPPKRKRLGE